MRSLTLPAGLALGLTLVASTTHATVTEPNGLQVPNMSGNELELQPFFNSRGESINALADAHDTPNAFSPLCGFTATFVLNQAGSHFGLSWYNETGVKPQGTDLHNLVPANSPVGTMFNGTAIMNDPAYLGGLVGFALIGGETHYTNPAYDNTYSNNQPWITALIYASTVTTNAYYICFEDGSTSSSGWNNDGDFNDDVFFLTGITCSGGGQQCDTGLPGICGPGITVCNANGTTCQQQNQPAATETCNGVDDNCNGQIDEGDICPTGYICDKGTCVQKCGSGEFTCPPQLVCDATGYCVDPACIAINCPGGQICVNGACKAPCDGIACPYPYQCLAGACIDPCAAVTCGAMQICDQGVCIPNCDCAICAAGTKCDAASGACVDPSCVGVMCPADQHCVPGGDCVDNCQFATCPSGQICQMGACVTNPDPTTSSSSSGVFVGAGGGGGSGAGGHGGAGGHAATSSSGTGGSGGGVGFVTKAGCGCRVADEDETGSATWLGAGAGALALLLAGRRRRR